MSPPWWCRDAREPLGILTDRDLRTQVVAGDVPADAAVSRVMTADPLTAAPDELGDKVLMDMLAAGVRHMPVIAADGGVLGVLEAQDLLVAEGRAPFRLRRAIDTAADAAALEHIAAQIRPALTELHDTRVAPAQVAAIMALLVDALTRRLIELGIERHGAPPAPFAWLALGSMGRAESAPSSDLDSALVWEGDDDDPADPGVDGGARRGRARRPEALRPARRHARRRRAPTSGSRARPTPGRRR